MEAVSPESSLSSVLLSCKQKHNVIKKNTCNKESCKNERQMADVNGLFVPFTHTLNDLLSIKATDHIRNAKDYKRNENGLRKRLMKLTFLP